jgi:hypothetical protein
MAEALHQNGRTDDGIQLLERMKAGELGASGVLHLLGAEGRMLHYRTYELGPQHEWVVFVHGAGGSSSIWFKQAREFRKHFNVLMVDLRGHGKSASPSDNKGRLKYTFQDISREILEVLDHLRFSGAFCRNFTRTIIVRTIGEIAPARMRLMILAAITRLNFDPTAWCFWGTA